MLAKMVNTTLAVSVYGLQEDSNIYIPKSKVGIEENPSMWHR